MDRNIQVSRLDRRAVEDQEVEIVERKGIGHPDSICDGIAESVSRALSQLYLDRVGKVLHYNTDETQLVAGRAARAYGGGEVVEPLYVLIVGRATKEYEGEQLPVDSTALAAARDYLSEAIPELEYGTDVIIDVKLGEGSGDLQDVFGEETQQVPMANDTSFGVGHAPLTETETIVYEAEHELNTTYHADHPELGPDVKIMGKREGDRIDITVAAAMVDRYVDGLDEYDDAVENVREFVTELAESRTDGPGGPRRRQHRRRLRRGLRLPHRHRHLRGAGRRRRVRGTRQPRERAHHSEPAHVHGGDLREEPRQPHREDLQPPVDPDRGVRHRGGRRDPRPAGPPALADRAPDRRAPRRRRAARHRGRRRALGDIEPKVLEIVDRELANVTDVTRSVIDGDVSTF